MQVTKWDVGGCLRGEWGGRAERCHALMHAREAPMRRATELG